MAHLTDKMLTSVLPYFIYAGSRESSNSGLVGGLAGLGAVLFVVFVMVSFSVCVILPLHVYHHHQQARVSSKRDVVSSMETDSTTVPDVSTVGVYVCTCVFV